MKNRLFAVLVVLILTGNVFAQNTNFRIQTHMLDVMENKHPMSRKQGIVIWSLFPTLEKIPQGTGEGMVAFGWFGARNILWGSADTTINFNILKNIKDERRDNLYLEVLLGMRAITHGFYDLFFQVPVSAAVFYPLIWLTGGRTHRYLSARVNWLPIEKRMIYSSFSLLTDDMLFQIPIRVGFGLDIPNMEEANIGISAAYAFKKTEYESFVVMFFASKKKQWIFRLEIILEDIGY